jgi:hypothetical protein
MKRSTTRGDLHRRTHLKATMPCIMKKNRMGPKMPTYQVVVSDMMKIEPGYARHLKQTLSDLGLHVRVRRVHRYERLSSDPPRHTEDVLHDVQLHPGSTVRAIASRMYPNEARGGEVDRVRAEMKARRLANKLVREGQLKKKFDQCLRFFPATIEPICICVPIVGSDGKLIPQPSPECPITEHSRLARDLIDAAQGRGRP